MLSKKLLNSQGIRDDFTHILRVTFIQFSVMLVFCQKKWIKESLLNFVWTIKLNAPAQLKYWLGNLENLLRLKKHKVVYIRLEKTLALFYYIRGGLLWREQNNTDNLSYVQTAHLNFCYCLLFQVNFSCFSGQAQFLVSHLFGFLPS